MKSLFLFFVGLSLYAQQIAPSTPRTVVSDVMRDFSGQVLVGDIALSLNDPQYTFNRKVAVSAGTFSVSLYPGTYSVTIHSLTFNRDRTETWSVPNSGTPVTLLTVGSSSANISNNAAFDNSGNLVIGTMVLPIPACSTTPPTTGNYKYQCLGSDKSVYTCANAANCTVSGDWGSGGGAPAGAMTQATPNSAANTVSVSVGTSGTAFAKTPVTIDPSTGAMVLPAGATVNAPGGFSGGTTFSASGGESATPSAPTADMLVFNSTYHIPQFTVAGASTVSATEVVPTTCTNQFVSAIPSTGTPTCASVALAAAVSGVLPIANGGTNASSAVQGAVPNTSSTTAAGWTVTPTLGVPASTTGTQTYANATGSGTFTVGASPSTTTNTLLGPTAVPTTGHLLDVTVSGTVATLHDSAIPTANVVNASSPGAGIAHFAGSTQTVTSAAVSLTADVSGVLPVGNLPVLHGQCTEAWGGSGTSFAMQANDDYIVNNACYNDSGATRTITAIKCRSDAASNSVTLNPSFGAAGTGTSILTGAVTCGNSYAYSATGTLGTGAAIAWTTGTGIDPVMAGTLTGSTSIALLIEYTYQPY